MTDKLLLSESAIPKASAPPLAPTKAMMYPAFASAPTAPEAANHLPTEHTPVARPVVHGPPPQQQQQQPVLMATSPSPFIVNMLPKGKWSSGLLTGCLGDPGGCHGCLYSCLCPCMAFGDIVGRMDSSESMVGGSWWGGCCAHFWLGGCVTQWNIFFCNLMMWATCSHLVHVPVRTAIRWVISHARGSSEKTPRAEMMMMMRMRMRAHAVMQGD